jgi:glucose/arabinose dehydrogenase
MSQHYLFLFLKQIIIFCISALTLSGWFQSSCSAQSEFAPGENFVEEVFLKDLPISTAIAFGPGNKAFLALKAGIVRVVDKGVLQTTPFIDLAPEVNRATDRGLLGLAVDPSFPQKPFIYLSYVYDPPGMSQDTSDPRVIRIVRITADAAQDYNVALPGSLEVIVGSNSTAENIAPPVPTGDLNIPERASCMTGLTMDGAPIEDCIACDATSHTAGTLIFGGNRTLYASLGDGADYNGPTRVGLRTQNLDSLSGRVLRINPDTGAGLPDNPWYDPAKPKSNRSRVWSYGFRNPFRITLHPSTSDVYIGDVGTSYYEEINAGKGLNFGWPCYEGGFTLRSQQEGEATASMEQVGYRAHPRTVEFCRVMYGQGQEAVRKPLFNYRHPYDENGRDLGASVTGLAFYSGTAYPTKYQGALFFADYAQKWIKYLTFDSNGRPTVNPFAVESGSNLGAVELLSGPDRSIYAVYIDLKSRTSQVRRFRWVGAGNTPPIVKASLTPLFGSVPLVVSAVASNSYDPDGQKLSYEWDFGDGTKSSEAIAEHVYTKPGTYAVKITVRETTAPFASSTDTFEVRSGLNKPIATILLPLPLATFEIGKPVLFEGRDDSGSSPPSSLHWAILQIHNQHTHLVTEFDGAKGSFIPTEHSDNTRYQLCLEASRGEGVTDQSCLEIKPRTTPYIFDSFPQGATISYLDEELDAVTPYRAMPIVGSIQSIRAATVYAGRSFAGWRDGIRSAVRTFPVGKDSSVFTATYENLQPRVKVSLATMLHNRKRRSAFFDASGSSDPEAEALRFVWRFSDGTRYNTPTIRKSFKREGTYRVILTVSDALGAQSTVSRKVLVSTRRGVRFVR